MRNLVNCLVFFGVCGLILGQIGCRRNKPLALSDTRVVFDEGRDETKTLAITFGTAADVKADEEVSGVTAQLDGAVVKVTTTTDAKAGTYRFHVTPKRGTRSVQFEVDVLPGIQLVSTQLAQAGPPPQDPQSFEPLVLDVDALKIAQGQTCWINAKSGAIASVHTDSTNVLKVSQDGDCRKLEISALEEAAPGRYPITVKGKDGIEISLNVTVQEVRMLVIEPSVEFNLDHDVTKTVKVAIGTATAVRDTNVEGLSAKVGSGGKTVEIAATKDVPPGKHQVVVEGKQGASYGIWVTVTSADKTVSLSAP